MQTPPSGLEPTIREGLQLGKYTLIRPLGSGGMAQVFLAHKPILDRMKVCALKMSIDLVGADETLRSGLVNEIRIASMLTHSNIVQVFDAGIVHGILFIELECIDGMDLAVLLESMRDRQTEMSIEMAIYIVRAVLEGLHYAHTFSADGVQQGIIHRDLSPHNVLISSSGEVKIMDFGIGKTAHDETSNRHIKGKVRYMAPEHVDGKAGAQADLFAVGAMLYEMLEGQSFRPRAEQHIMLAAAAFGAAPELERDDIPPMLVTFYQRLTARELDERFANAAEALRFLGLIRGGEIHAQDMRTFYERQLDRGRHSGYTRSSIAVPPSFFQLLEAIKAINPEQQAAGATPTPVEQPDLHHEQRRAIADVRQAARQQPPARARDRDDDAPSVVRRSSGLGGRARHEVAPASATIDAPPPYLRGKPGSPADGAAPGTLGPAGTVRLDPEHARPPVMPTTDEVARPQPRRPRRPSSVTPPPWDPSSATPRPTSIEPDGTRFVVATRARGLRFVLLGSASAFVGLVVLFAWWLVPEPTELERVMPTPSATVVERPIEGGSDVDILEPEVAGPVLDPLPLPSPPAPVQDATPSTGEPQPIAPEPSTPVAVEPLPAATPTVSTSTAAKPKKPAGKQADIEVRLAPNFIDGEVKIGKRSWLVAKTFDVLVPPGQYSLAWRKQGEPQWRAAGRVVLVPGLRYLVRVGPESLALSSSPAEAKAR